MSAVTTLPPKPAANASPGRGRLTQARVIKSEVLKLASLRSTRYSLLAGCLAMVLMPVAIAIFTMTQWAHLNPDDRDLDAINNAVSGYQLAQLAVGVLGVLVITGEYSTGSIRSTFMAVPKRLPVLWAKLLVFCSATFALMLVSAFVAFLVTQPILHQHGLDKSLGDPHAVRCIIGAALYLTVIGALGVGLGTLIRNTAGGIATFVGILFVLPGVTALLPHATAESVNRFLPVNAGSAVLTSRFEAFHRHLSPWIGFGVFCLYAAIAISVAAVKLVQRDV
ncbi:MAG: type transport system permease protein [Solirubrobacteraceae bacterium]|jgi:ABC-type transport system involved in multi-copper enzyme maturation permease subunit|nr:type transport system permease protein [Solirubrobacteraceae bacterium]